MEDVFEAYFECRKKKRNTCNALAFESDYERRCVELWREINAGTYRPSRSIAFIINKPVKREIFAADFRDRVVHHLIAHRLVPLLEEKFIDDSYSTRKGKGTLYGIERVEEHIRLCSENYTRDCYILKIDIRSFFMKISKRRLYDLTEELLHERYGGNDLAILLYLLRETIFNRPEKNCIRKTPPQSWRGLPKDKSLFHSDGSCGLPIGNLTSQLLALNFLDGLDHLISEEWGVKHYGRYVDDMVLVHPSKEHLIEVKAKIAGWLSEHGLSLHPRKIYLQHYTKRCPVYRRDDTSGAEIPEQPHSRLLLRCHRPPEPLGGRLARLRENPRGGVCQYDKLLFGNDAAFFLLQPAVQGHEPYR